MKGYVNEELKETEKNPNPVIQQTALNVQKPMQKKQKENIESSFSLESKNGFVLCLFGSVLNLLVGSSIILWVIIKFWRITSANGDLNKVLLISLLGVALYLLVLGIWILALSYWMKDYQRLKKGSIACLVLGLLSVNPLAIIGGLIGLRDYKKFSPNIKSI